MIFITKETEGYINNKLDRIIGKVIETNKDTIKEFKNKLNSINLDNINVVANSKNQDELEENINNILNGNGTNNTENINYKYYELIFSKEDNTRKKLNEQLFYYIKVVNIILILVLILFTIYLLATKAITITDIIGLIVENLITFIFVGMIEYYFFTNVASKYIPANPSIIFKSFLNSMKDNFTKI
jgi:hypothetical protein